MGLFDEPGARSEQQRRSAIRDAVIGYLRRRGFLDQKADIPDVLRACLEHMARGPVQVVLATIEDLWQATEPQNVPGTWNEKPNWRRKALHPLEAFDGLPGLRDTLLALHRAIQG